MLFFTFIPIVLMAAGSLIGGGYRSQGEIVEILDSPSKTLRILNKSRGIMALEILINHIFWNSGALSGRSQAIWGPLTFSIVSYFFFVSGYGMQLKEFKNKVEVVSDCVKKLFFLLLVNLIAVLIGFLIRILIGFNSENILQYLFNHTNWYIYELLTFYLIFYIANILFLEREKAKIRFVT